MKKVVYIVTILMLLALGCERSNLPRFVANWDSVEIGMSKEQVISLLGEPIGKHGPAKVEIEHDGDSEPAIAAAGGLAGMFFDSLYEYWEYDSINREELSQEQAVEELVESLFGPSDESFVVYFDENGKVKKLRRPLNK